MKMRAGKKEPARNRWRSLRRTGHVENELFPSNMDMLIQYPFSLKEAIETWSQKYWGGKGYANLHNESKNSC